MYLVAVFFLSQNILGQTFGVIGDYGVDKIPQLDVSNLMKSWNPDLIITVGDNNYQGGDSLTIDKNIGKYFHEYIYPYKGTYGLGGTINRFFPTLGNHDVRTADGKPYFDYFTLPGNERYYDFVWGDVHFFALNSDTTEIDGDSSASVQGQWLKNALESSISPWKIVYFHESPYTSEEYHRSQPRLQWPFVEWGATAVLTGHSHNYERIFVNGLTYMVNGLGGHGKRAFVDIIPESLVQYNQDYGAMKVVANNDSIVFMFINRADSLIDYYSINKNTEDINTKQLKPEIELKNFPNPFKISTRISFVSPSTGFAELKVYNLYGKEITTLLSENITFGKYEVQWMAENLQSGVYYYCLYFADFVKVVKAVIIN